ncbi:hypothetical protein Acid345_4617 [Candidatus Koribacter versatilis Ellin345]|uniref:Uncharacterized protein n=1 Tax=Koribacter versatilis (strain Ellin345) TaxID=204669 RepID=Q1IHN3_KORVE|nr:hypothetical protein [Candidatus Koribacter versatilis]ABF43617.1 hypothetical protein Acid345_4617 [Candidatus Koribacter versatilis Ellin345]
MASQIKAKTCHHIKANGTCCKSPALTNEDYCYFHTAQRQRMRRQRRVEHKSLHAPLVLPLLEDAESIQIAIGDVLNALIIGRIDHKTAGLLLYGLQTAASNIRQAKFAVAADQAEFPSEYRDAENELLEKEIAEDLAQERQRQAAEIAKMQKERERVFADPNSGIAPLPTKKPSQPVAENKSGAARAVGLSRK